MIILPLSVATEADVISAYRLAGGVIVSTTPEARVGTGSLVDCASTPSMYADRWTYENVDQLPNLYKGVVDMGDVMAVQAPSQVHGFTRLSVIEHELEHVEFVGVHCAEWYMRPENKAAFFAVCPSGYLVFLEKHRLADRNLGVMYISVRRGQLCVDRNHAGVNGGFDGVARFAARRK